MSDIDENEFEDKRNYPDYVEKVFEFNITQNQSPERLDRFLTRSITNASRTKVQKAIDAEQVLVNGEVSKHSRKIQPGDNIRCTIMKPPPVVLVPENIPLDIIFEDEYLLVVNKPPGMVSHPGFGNRYGTLVNAVLWHTGKRENIEVDTEFIEEPDEKIFASMEVRPGIVHRLDKDTSGTMVIAKNPDIHAKLAEQFADRTIGKYYYTIAWGEFDKDEGTIEGDIGRSPKYRKQFAIVKRGGKYARTDYQVLERFRHFTLLKIKLHTGRTHQIRVHLAFNHHPILGDSEYGGAKVKFGGQLPEFRKMAERCLDVAQRQMLHAGILEFTHPVSGERLSFSSDLPDDMKKILEILKNY